MRGQSNAYSASSQIQRNRRLGVKLILGGAASFAFAFGAVPTIIQQFFPDPHAGFAPLLVAIPSMVVPAVGGVMAMLVGAVAHMASAPAATVVE
jgi:hypothetical protein